MTTGRINQVTILTGRPLRSEGRKDHRQPSIKKGSGLVKRSGREPKPNAQPRSPLGPKPPKVPMGDPICPTELPKEWSAATLGIHDPKACPRCAIYSSEGGYQPPVTPGGGYELRLTPKCLWDNDSHRPIIHRLRQSSRENPMSLQTTLTQSRCPAVQNHWVLRR